MYRFKVISVGLMLVAFACLTTCSDKTTIVQNNGPTNQAKISGQLLAWRCSICDAINNRSVDPRFGVETGDTARIIILYTNDWQDSVLTDSLSRFERIVDLGLHKIVVETRYTWPDTFQVYVGQDTAIDLKIVYGVWRDPDTVVITFTSGTGSDSLNASKEWQALRTLNGRLNGVLNIFGDQPVLLWRSVYQRYYVSWSIPIRNREDNVLAVSKLAGESVVADTLHTISPTPVNIYPKGIYMCMWGSSGASPLPSTAWTSSGHSVNSNPAAPRVIRSTPPASSEGRRSESAL